MGRERRVDGYGSMSLVLRDDGGTWWVVEAIGADGKRRPAPEVVIPTDVDDARIVDELEALYHEAGRPGSRISIIG
ncbi:MAG TPA: hypothetical protein VLD62_01975 [Acidimicrobiia bacterium]|nr:hypothetical protein [Acidimicrobiia bacterium]